uniref:hypothetical protein n=1 Tax=Prevotella sp. TaxID=59823 RepID=UPI0040299D6F
MPEDSLEADICKRVDESCHKQFLFVGSFANIGKILEMQALLCEKLENKGSSAIWVDATMTLCSYP